jgi:uracil-DNA glycosylase
MAWSERQHRMLRAMGLRVWTPALRTAVAVPEPVQIAAGEPAVAAPVAAAAQVAQVVPRPAATPVSPGAIAAMDWDALREAVAGCRACALCDSRTQTVFGVGHRQAHWMVVGEAPGEQEDLSGEPFVGAAGQLLDRMLAALQLTRAEDGEALPSQRVYIANTLKCRPPRNRNPLAQEVAQCEPYLVRQIELLRPRLILAMGRFAVQSLLRSDEPIGRLRGRVHRYQGVPLVVTYHPAYLLRNLPDKAKAWEDLCLAASVAEAAAAAQGEQEPAA